jgi:sigma-B regulation protein RsbU (phosphoserine phosphatase)
MESVIRCIELGAEDYLSKPFNPTLLHARVGASLEKKRLRDEIVRVLHQIEAELQAARQIQLSMVPTEFVVPTPQRPMEIYATLEPARRVGGDLYDFFWGDDGRMYFVVADVSDKGAPAALFMARTKTMLRLVATLCRHPDGAPMQVHEIIEKVNEGLSLENQQSMFVTVFFGVFDPAAATLSYCNAGHPPPYLLDSGGVSVVEGARGKPLGIRPSFSYRTESFRLEPGQGLFLYTDGITEALNSANEFFAEERLEETLRSLTVASAREMVVGVMERVREFAGDALQADDIAAMGLRFVHSSLDTITIGNRRDELPRATAALDDFASRHGVPKEVLADLQVALSEILTNIVDYAFSDEASHEIAIRLQRQENAVEVTIEDDGIAFDPLTQAAPDTAAPLHARRVGGLGVHFAKNLMSEIRYQRSGDRNRLRLRKAFDV